MSNRYFSLSFKELILNIIAKLIIESTKMLSMLFSKYTILKMDYKWNIKIRSILSDADAVDNMQGPLT